MYFSSSKKGRFAPAYNQAQIKVGEINNNTTGGKVLIMTNDACIEGISGSFSQVKHDFRLQGVEENNSNDQSSNMKEVGPPHKFRFLLCSLALLALSLNLMSRMILNVAIVEMTRKVQPDEDLQSVTQDSGIQESSSTDFVSTDSILSTSINSSILMEQPKHLDPLHFNWSAKEQNFLISAFYIGYAPAMMVSGGLTDRYGSKYILLLTIVGSSMINLVTPYIAGISLHLLISSRICLGIIQGGLVPALYGLFNKWLTMTETSIFVPLTKVSFAFGSLIGASLPGIAVYFGYEWPIMFHFASFVCAIWAIIWYPLSTSIPQTNKFVSSEELRWIMRKKQQNFSANVDNNDENGRSQEQVVPPPPWLLIIKNPSVIALTLTKLTYNIGMDFIFLELSTYLKAIFNTPTKTISAIASGTCLTQLFLVTFVGWAAKFLVNNGTFGLSRTKWRKAFQGSSNFAMALMYFALPIVGKHLWPAAILLYLICIFWLLGTGGESMIPYDLSERYPATIVGVAQSLSVLSGFIVPTLCSLILGNENTDPKRWDFMFNLLAGALTFGGLVFVCAVKAKPFLPGEKVAKAPVVTITVNDQQVSQNQSGKF